MIRQQFPISRYFAAVIGLLRDRKGFLEEIRQGVNLKHKIVALLISSSVFFAIYGAIIGAYHSIYQVISSAIKLPSLYLITMLICLPTLFFFNVFFGSRQSVEQHLALLLSAVSVISVLLFSFAPITLFFQITAPHYQFLILLNVGIFFITGLVGINFFYKAMLFTAGEDNMNGQGIRIKMLKFWLLLYAFVGSQMAWTLRPFFGTPGSPFELFREREGNFYLTIINAIAEILGI